MVYRATQTMKARDTGRGLNYLETDNASPCFQFCKRGLVREGQSLHPEGTSCPGDCSSSRLRGGASYLCLSIFQARSQGLALNKPSSPT